MCKYFFFTFNPHLETCVQQSFIKTDLLHCSFAGEGVSKIKPSFPLITQKNSRAIHLNTIFLKLSSSYFLTNNAQFCKIDLRIMVTTLQWKLYDLKSVYDTHLMF